MIETTTHEEINKPNKSSSGFLRKSRKLVITEEHKSNDLEVSSTTQNLTHKPKQHINRNNKVETPTETIEKVESNNKTNKEHPLISYMRQRNGFNPIKFWQDLELTLKNNKFADITYNGLSLLSYAAFFAKDDIYPELLSKYGSTIPKEEFENTIFIHCLNNNIIFLQNTLTFYEAQYQPSSEFIEFIIKKATKTSYRLDNNKELLNWLDNKITPQHIQLFWNSCIETKNTSLFETALHYKNLHTYLINNYIDYKEKIQKLGKTHLVELSFLSTTYYNHSLTADINKNESNYNCDKTTTDNLFSHKIKASISTQPEVIIKKKRKFS